jgi:hypothetical protein
MTTDAPELSAIAFDMTTVLPERHGATYRTFCTVSHASRIAA